MYRVKDLEGNIIIVEAIDKKLHRHPANWREFTSDDNVKFVWTLNSSKETETKKPLKSKSKK